MLLGVLQASVFIIMESLFEYKYLLQGVPGWLRMVMDFVAEFGMIEDAEDLVRHQDL